MVFSSPAKAPGLQWSGRGNNSLWAVIIHILLGPFMYLSVYAGSNFNGMAWTRICGKNNNRDMERTTARRRAEFSRLGEFMKFIDLLPSWRYPQAAEGETDRHTDFAERRKKERKWLNVIVYVENQSIILNRSYYPPITHRPTDSLHFAEEEDEPTNNNGCGIPPQRGGRIRCPSFVTLLYFHLSCEWERKNTAAACKRFNYYYLHADSSSWRLPTDLARFSPQSFVRALVSPLLPSSWYSCSMWVSELVCNFPVLLKAESECP